jgi:Subtilase family
MPAIAGVAAVAAALSGLAAPGAASAGPSSPRVHHARVGTHYAVFKPVCAASHKFGRASCLAIRRIPATRTTPHARAYDVPAAYARGPKGGYTPNDLAHAYGYDPTTVPATAQTVAVVDAYDDPNIFTDLNHFDAQYGLSAETPLSLQKVNQDGDLAPLPRNDPSGWSEETALDVETVRAVCNSCTILLVEADSPSMINLRTAAATAARLGATEISNSYGSPEPPRGLVSKGAINSFARAYDHRGVVVTAATGDEGWFSWDFANAGGVSGEAPNMPSSFAHVIAVGGTTLKLHGDGTRRSETVWNNNGKANAKGSRRGALGGTGGGCSKWINAPTWQHHVAGYRNTGCGKKRLAADVAADGDPQTGIDVYSSWDCGKRCHPGWTTIGGTSLSSPLIAAMWALAGGAGGVAYPAASLYAHAKRGHSRFFDVTHGANSWCGGLTHATCAKRTGKVTRGAAKNPNFLAIGHRNLGTLDCGFKRHTHKTTAVKPNLQCKAARGYDGPSGVGTPKGLAGFLPPAGA